MQVDGTPTFFINGQRFAGAQPLEAFEARRQRAGKRHPAGRLGATVSGEVLDLAMSRGPVDAPVTIRWFADSAARCTAMRSSCCDRYWKRIRPTSASCFSIVRSRAARRRCSRTRPVAAAEQGRFWDVHDSCSRGRTARRRGVARNVAASRSRRRVVRRGIVERPRAHGRRAGPGGGASCGSPRDADVFRQRHARRRRRQRRRDGR